MSPRLCWTLAAACVAAAPSLAAAQPVTPSNPQGWTGTANSGSSTAITGANPRNGNGSLEISGTQSAGVAIRTRYDWYVPSPTTNSLGSLESLQSFGFDWYRSGTSTVGGVQAPAFRLYLRTGTGSTATYSQMIWEWANNTGGAGSAPVDMWQSVTTSLTSGLFHRFVSGSGNQQANCTFGNQTPQTLQTWVSTCASGAEVIGISAGVGSIPASDGQSFLGYADNISIQFVSQSEVPSVARVYNFETDVSANVVPEPSTYALMGTGLLGLAGAAARRRRQSA